MSSSLLRAILILRAPQRSQADLEYLTTQLMLLGDLRQYLCDLSEAKKMRLMTAVRVEDYEEGQFLFSKGDKSTKLYVILTGKVDMLDVEGRNLVHIATLGSGKMIGERGLVRKTVRMLTARVQSKVVLMTLDEAHFRVILETAVFHRLEEKLKFIERYLPYAKSQATSMKERLTYAFQLAYYRRGQRLISQGEMADVIYFVKSGECTVTEKRGRMQRKVVGLTIGSWTGEESVLLNRHSSYTVTISSEEAWLYELTRISAAKLLSEVTVELMKEQYFLKYNSRKKLADRVISLTPSASPDPIFDSRFHLASPVARRMLAINPNALFQQLRGAQDQRIDELRIELNERREIGPLEDKHMGVKSELGTPRLHVTSPGAVWKLRHGPLSDRHRVHHFLC